MHAYARMKKNTFMTSLVLKAFSLLSYQASITKNIIELIAKSKARVISKPSAGPVTLLYIV